MLTIIGGPASGKKSLLRGLLELLAAPHSGDFSIDPIPDCPTPALGHSLELKTKYYTARVNVRILPSEIFLNPDPSVVAKALENSEAIVLLSDASKGRAAFDSQVKKWSTLISENASSPSTLVLASTKVDLVSSDSFEEEETEAASALLLSSNSNSSSNSSSGAGDGGSSTAGDGSISDSSSSSSSSVRVAYSPGALLPLASAATFPASSSSTKSGSGEVTEWASMCHYLNDWALDEGFEHVECVATKPIYGNATRDKVSLPRILEALQTTMWSSMVRSKAPSSSSTSSSFASSLLASSSSDTSSSNSATSGTRVKGEEIPSSSSSSTSEKSSTATGTPLVEGMATSSRTAAIPDLTEEEAALERALAADILGAASGGGKGGSTSSTAHAIGSSSSASSNSAAPPPKHLFSMGPTESGAEDDSDQVDRSMSRMVEELRSVRERAMKGNLTDAQRREAAAAAAMKMLAMMSELGIDDADDDEGEEESTAKSAGPGK